MVAETLLDLRKFVAPEFIFGHGAASLAGRYVHNLSARKSLVISDPGVMSSGWTDHVCKSLEEYGLGYSMFVDVSPNPRDTQVMAGAARYEQEGCDSIVAVGGGSVLDLAKGVGIVHSNQQHILDFEGVDAVPNPGPPMVCIPTTAGSSADVSQFAIITDSAHNAKIAIVSKSVVPDVALIDPALTMTMDRNLTAHTGMDALTHAIEAYVSNANSPITDLFALEAVRRITHSLPAALERGSDLEARAGMMLGSLYAGIAFSNAILGAVHAMAHSLGGLLDLPHGVCNAVLLDYVIDFNFSSAQMRYIEVGKAMGAAITDDMEPDAKKEAVLEAVQRLKRKAGITQRLADLGVKAEDLTSLAQHAFHDPCLATNPVAVTPEELEAIYAQAL
ncbi:alcohol dehydrogenase-like regulatory protein ErcA [Oceanidesulfovibrio marinus]|uniref:Alcohol dehydrogenase n=1 Tax=Oceanidesulfovibrio marinus TaxID=370038 RepID=A0A6P1ZBU1_9BACT|nr:alcohol dehydrogenase-like regulatory protein ErcA [Oceanidesulfovibrio marinus]QJT10412.1 iron-containing alcohol dehydrogenase [Oceanidesulfovibrio marinus]TVM30659.1 alcohol dehydrogenase [Oceanidesulfovibrio marinus]